jgi:hypothetical protein
MKPHDSVQVVKKWWGVRTDPVVRCFNNPERLNCRDSLVGIVPEFPSFICTCRVRI